MEDNEVKKEEQIELDLPEDDDPSQKYIFPWRGFIIVFGVLITLIIVCVIVILCNGGFYQW